jgi:nitroreductase
MPNNQGIVSLLSQVPLLDALKARYATKKFDPTRRIDAETWDALEQSLVLTPSSFGLQPWQFLIVENPELRTALRAASWGQSQPTDASHLVIFTARTSLSDEDVTEWSGFPRSRARRSRRSRR